MSEEKIEVDKDRIMRIAERIVDAVLEEEEFNMYEIYNACGIAQHSLIKRRDSFFSEAKE